MRLAAGRAIRADLGGHVEADEVALVDQLGGVLEELEGLHALHLAEPRALEEVLQDAEVKAHLREVEGKGGERNSESVGPGTNSDANKLLHSHSRWERARNASMRTHHVVIELVGLRAVHHPGHHPLVVQCERRVQVHPVREW